MDGRAVIANITAKRLGCTDPTLLKIIERLACAKIEVQRPQYSESNAAKEPLFFLAGSVDGKPFIVTISGEAIREFALGELPQL